MMKRLLSVVVILGLVVVWGGCCCLRSGCGPRVRGYGLTGLVNGSCVDCPETCQSCPTDPAGDRVIPRLGCCGVARAPINPGPPTAAITYPYYTVRGPRDFLQREPSPIGP